MSARQLTLVASTLTNACGVGWAAVRETLRNGRSALRPFDLEWAPPFATWIGRAPGLESVRMPDDFPALDSRNNRLAHLCLEQDDFPAAVAAAVARHGRDRIGLFVGTTTSGILSTELAYRARLAALPDAGTRPALVRDVHNMHATTAFVRCLLDLAGPVQTISTACSSSAKVFAAAARFISADLCDAAVVGGVDSLALSTLFGFRALDLVSTGPCRPFAADRDGISIGEGAGFALLEPGGEGPVCLLGHGDRGRRGRHGDRLRESPRDREPRQRRCRGSCHHHGVPRDDAGEFDQGLHRACARRRRYHRGANHDHGTRRPVASGDRQLHGGRPRFACGCRARVARAISQSRDE